MRRVLLLLIPFMLLNQAYAADAGTTKGSAIKHTAQSLADGLANATIALPAGMIDEDIFFGHYSELPKSITGPIPLMIFQHGSSGINPKLGYDKWQKWLADQGVASIIFDSFQLPDRLTYTSPISRDIYEQIHALRASEIDYMINKMKVLPWVDPANIFLAGTSEGSTTVARNDNKAIAGRIIYSWSCEDNYFVSVHKTAVNPGQPTLNIISQSDPYFSMKNAFIDNAQATGNCAAALAANDKAEVLTIPNAPHTLINMPAAQSAVSGWLAKVIK